ncbi:MAG TPA: hypothetical protein DIC56_14655 [Rhizobium sp.]|nr:hypothetical protein [Rhizobium sp.]
MPLAPARAQGRLRRGRPALIPQLVIRALAPFGLRGRVRGEVSSRRGMERRYGEDRNRGITSARRLCRRAGA